MKNLFSKEISSCEHVINMWGDSYDTKTLKSIERFDQFGLRDHHVGRYSKRLGYTGDHRLSPEGQKPTHNGLPKVFCGSTRPNKIPSSFQTSPPRGWHCNRSLRIRPDSQWTTDAFLRSACGRREDNNNREVPRWM